MESRVCSKFLDPNYESYVAEYRGDFEGQMAKVDYACGRAINDALAVIAVERKNMIRLRKDVPSIIFIEIRSLYVLQDLAPTDVDKVGTLKANPYLNLTGREIVVAMIDTGINYLNKEFIREDDTTRILSIWDQTIQSDKADSPYIGTIYTKEEINEAIQASLRGEDPYKIVPSKDDIGHGTQMAGIVGARGYNGEMQGIANDCDFLIVKLLPSPTYTNVFTEENLEPVPIYNNTEILAAIEFARGFTNINREAMVIFLGVGSNDGSHDGFNITAKYITSGASSPGVVYVAGTGNQGNAQGHVRRFINNIGEVSTIELVIPVEMKYLSIDIWVQKPTRMSLGIMSPTGEETGYFVNQIISYISRTFYLINTKVEVIILDPESLTGHQLFVVTFINIKPGIWKFKLKAEYVSNGRFDIWLPPFEVLPAGTKFLESNDENTLTIPATARNVVSVAYFDGLTNAIVAESGKGFNTNKVITPDIATAGTNILTITKAGDRVVPVKGSSVATAITAGACALLMQWAFIDENDLSLDSSKARSLLIYAAERPPLTLHPNENWGYGKLDILEVFNILSGTYKRTEDFYRDYEVNYMNDLYIRMPKSFYEERQVKKND